VTHLTVGWRHQAAVADMLKYLRIAVTALSLTACVLLIALWVRSYRSIDLLCCPIPGAHSFEIQSKHGWLGIRWLRDAKWHFAIYSMDEGANSVVDTYWPRRIALIENARQTALIIPHSFPVLLLCGLAVVPWMPGRFSLRTLLIATTLVALGLGVIVLVV
jgi:hypothetical protein